MSPLQNFDFSPGVGTAAAAALTAAAALARPAAPGAGPGKTQLPMKLYWSLGQLLLYSTLKAL